jgi:hypothetical protein
MNAGPSGYWIRSDPCRLFVEAWSSWALPFMNRTAVQSQYRDDLRQALSGLTPGGGLTATHTSQYGPRAPDVENLLFYNVGTSVFRPLAKDGLQFQRTNAPPPEAPTRLDFEARHHVRYEASGTNRSPFHHTNADAVIASANASCVAPTQIRDLADLWRSFKTAMVMDADSAQLTGRSFAVQFTILAAARHRLNLTDIVKPLTDAFTSALHCYQGVQLEEVVNRVSARLRCPSHTAHALLLDTRAALLGPRAVPHLRGDGLQWSPADESLIGCEILRETSQGDTSIEIRARLFSASTL